MRKKGNLNHTCLKVHKVDELNVSCRESDGEDSCMRLFFILKEKISLDTGQKEALFLHTKDIYD